MSRIQPQGFTGIYGFNFYPGYLLLVQTPEIILLLSAVGIIGSWVGNKKTAGAGWLLLLWLIIPIIRISLPGVWFYNGFRQIMEVLPALAILTGLGIGFLMHVILRRQLALLRSGPKNLISRMRSFDLLGMTGSILILILIFSLLAYPIIHLFPNENLYFNSLAGGGKGAVQK